MAKLIMLSIEKKAIPSEIVDHLLEDAARVFVEEGNIASHLAEQSTQPKKQHTLSVYASASRMQSGDKVRSWLRDLENVRRGVP